MSLGGWISKHASRARHEIHFYEWHLQSISNLNRCETVVMFSFRAVGILVGCRMFVESDFWAFLIGRQRHCLLRNGQVYSAGVWYFCLWHPLTLYIWTASDLLHLISDPCGFWDPASIRSTLRRNTETKRSWGTVTAAQTSTGKNTKRKTRTKRRGEKRRFVNRSSVCFMKSCASLWCVFSSQPPSYFFTLKQHYVRISISCSLAPFTVSEFDATVVNTNASFPWQIVTYNM